MFGEGARPLNRQDQINPDCTVELRPQVQGWLWIVMTGQGRVVRGEARDQETARRSAAFTAGAVSAFGKISARRRF